MATRILIVDDDEGILEFMAAALEINGYEVLQALSAAQGMDIILNNKVDLLVTDMKMPEGSGADLLSLTKLAEQKIPVVVMSGAISSREDFPPSVNVRFLDKPFTIDELKEAVKRSLLSSGG